MKTTEEKLNVLARIAQTLNQAGVAWAIGASTMLYFHHIAEDFHDLDIMVDVKDALKAKELLSEMGTLHETAPKENYRTKYFFELTIDGVDIDLIGGFAIEKEGTVYDCALKREEIDGSVTVLGQKVPMQSVRAWRRFYELMGRTAKVELIDRAIDK